MLECNNFWRKISQLQPLELLYHNLPPNGVTYSRIQIGGDSLHKLPAPKRVEPMNEARLEGTLSDLPSLQQNSDLKQYYKEALEWHLKTTVQELELSATLCGRLYEDVGDRYIWKTKWGLPPSLIKATSMINPPPAELQNLIFDMQLVEASLDGNTFIVVPEGIRGQTRRQPLNNFCEFKGLKLACSQQGQKRRLMILAWLADPINPKNRRAVDCFISPEIQVFSENGRVIQIEKAQQFMHYFQLFDPDVFQKSNRRVEEDKQHFYVYMLKKNPKIKNILYIAFKFPEIVSIYINRSQLKGENGGHKTPTQQFCELLFTHQEPTEGSQLHLVANYLNPESRIVMKIDCPPEEFKFIINRDFTSIMSVLVGDVIPIDLDKFVKIDQEVKPTYIRFYRKLTDSQASDKEAEEAPVGSQSEASPIKNLDLEEQRGNDPKGEGSKEAIKSQKQHKNKHVQRKKNNVDEDEDSLFVSNGQQEQVSSASFSDRKIKRTSYAKWLEKSKRGTLKQKEQHKKMEKFMQNSKSGKAPQGQTKPSSSANVGLPPKPSSQPVQFQPSQVSYVLMDTQQGRIFSPQQMQLIQPNMPLSMSPGNIIAASQGGFGGVVPTNTGSTKILIGNPQMMNGQAQLMQVIQRDKEQDQQKFNTSDGKQGMKWSQPQLQSQPQITGFVASQQQSQPTILMGNPQIGFNSLGQLGQMNQFGQISPFGQMNPIGFNQFGQFSQFPQNSSTQLITIPAQAFMPQQNMPTYQNIVVADQMPAVQNNSAFRPALSDQSGGITNQITASQNNGVKIERDQNPSPNTQSNRGPSGVETRHQRNRQDKEQPSQPRQEINRQQITQELRPAIIMPSGYAQQMPNFNMMQQLGLQGLQAVIPQQNGGMQGMQLVNTQPGQTFYAMPHTNGPVQAQLISVRQPNSTGDRLY